MIYEDSIGRDSELSKQCYQRRTERGVGHNWGKYSIGLFNVSEHLGHFKAIQNFTKKTGNSLVWG